MRRWLALVSLCLAIACGSGSSSGNNDDPYDWTKDPNYLHDDSPTTPTTIGGTCDTCTKGQQCIGEDAGFTGGYCTEACGWNSECPAGSVCLAAFAGIVAHHQCLRTCSPKDPCRAGYACVQILDEPLLCYPAFIPPVPPLPSDTAACAFGNALPGSAVASSLLSDALDWASSVAVAVDASGDHVLVSWPGYHDYRTMGVQVAVSADGGATFERSWLDLRSSDDWQDRWLPRTVSAAIDATGRYWIASGSTALNVYVDGVIADTALASSTDGQTWLGGRTARADNPTIAIHPQTGVPWLVVVDELPGKRILLQYVQPPSAPSTWPSIIGDPILIRERALDALRVDHPVIAFDDDGNAAIAWIEIAGDSLGDVDNRVLVQRVRSDGSLDGGPIVASTPSDTPVRDRPSIVFIGDQLIVAYTSGSPGGDWQIRAAVSLAGDSFASSVRVDAAADCSLALHPTLALDKGVATPRLHVVYYRALGAEGSVYRTVLAQPADGPGTFAPTTTTRLADGFALRLSGPTEIAPRIGIASAAGHVYSAWTQPSVDGKTTNVRFARETITP